MKFTEALKANETKRVKVIGAPHWLEVGELIDRVNKEDYKKWPTGKDWQVEPEKIEFECEWQLTPSREMIMTAISEEQDMNLILCHLEGKRTKVTIEVLE